MSTPVAPSSSARSGLIGGGIAGIVVGFLGIVVYYLSQGSLPIGLLGEFNLLIGLLVLVGGVVLVVLGTRLPRTERSPVAAGAATNNLAIAAFALAFFAALPAVICGHIALGQIARSGQAGRGLALAALVIGYISLGAGLIVAIVSLVVAR